MHKLITLILFVLTINCMQMLDALNFFDNMVLQQKTNIAIW